MSDNQTLSSNFNIGLYPNPTNLGFVNISTNKSGLISAEVYDILGKVVISSNVNNGRLNLSKLKAGMYIIKVTQNNLTNTKKLIIN